MNGIKKLIFFYKFFGCMLRDAEVWRNLLPRQELSQVYLAMAIRSFAVSLTSLFVPLYLYKELGYTLQETLLFFVFYALMFAISTPIAAKFCARYGMKHCVLLSVPFYVGYIILLQLLPVMKTPLILISALSGVSLALYWMGMNLMFQCVTDHKHRGEQVGKQMGVTILATMIGPVMGGAIIEYAGFTFLFVMATVFLLLGAGILFLSKDKHIPYHFSVRQLFNKKHWGDSLYFVSKGTRVMAEGVVWPLMVFMILGSYVSLGLMGTVFSFVSVILVWVVGKYSDHKDKRVIVWWSTGFESLTWFLRALVNSVSSVFGISILAGVTEGVKNAPMGALECDKAYGEIAHYYVVREIYICLGRMLLLLIVLMVDNLQAGMLFQGFFALAALWF